MSEPNKPVDKQSEKWTTTEIIVVVVFSVIVIVAGSIVKHANKRPEFQPSQPNYEQIAKQSTRP